MFTLLFFERKRLQNMLKTCDHRTNLYFIDYFRFYDIINNRELTGLYKNINYLIQVFNLLKLLIKNLHVDK